MSSIVIFSVTVMATFVDALDNLLGNQERLGGGYEVVGFVGDDFFATNRFGIALPSDQFTLNDVERLHGPREHHRAGSGEWEHVGPDCDRGAGHSRFRRAGTRGVLRVPETIGRDVKATLFENGVETPNVKESIAKAQTYQVGEAAQLRLYLPAQLVVGEAQPSKVGEAAQLRRYLAAQAVAAEIQPWNAPVAVGGDALPFAEGSVAQPVVVSNPVLTVRCVVEGNQGFPVRFGGAGGRGRRCRGRIGGSGRGPAGRLI